MVRGRRPRPPRGSPQALPHPYSRGTYAGTRMCVIYSPTALDAVFWALARRGRCRPTPRQPWTTSAARPLVTGGARADSPRAVGHYQLLV